MGAPERKGGHAGGGARPRLARREAPRSARLSGKVPPMKATSLVSDDRLFPAEPTERAIARRLYDLVRRLPIVSPHGHTNPAWFADNEPFADPSTLLIIPDHYIFRMLHSQGIPLESVGVPRLDGA